MFLVNQIEICDDAQRSIHEAFWREVSDTESSLGPISMHHLLEGRVRLLYSEKQRQRYRDHVIQKNLGFRPDQLEKCGKVVALDLDTGRPVAYTDLDILSGPKKFLEYYFSPYALEKSLNPELDVACDDWQLVATLNPRNLVILQSHDGTKTDMIFVHASPVVPSLVALYGYEEAIQILEIMKELPPDVRPNGVYIGSRWCTLQQAINEHVSLEHKRNTSLAPQDFPRFRQLIDADYPALATSPSLLGSTESILDGQVIAFRSAIGEFAAQEPDSDHEKKKRTSILVNFGKAKNALKRLHIKIGRHARNGAFHWGQAALVMGLLVYPFGGAATGLVEKNAFTGMWASAAILFGSPILGASVGSVIGAISAVLPGADSRLPKHLRNNAQTNPAP